MNPNESVQGTVKHMAQQAIPRQYPGIQHLQPVMQYTERPVGEEFVQPSIIQKLKPGQRVDTPDLGGGRYIVQRLTERTYWMMNNAFTTTAFVGDEGVLLIDAPGSLNPNLLFTTLQEFTNLPISTLVYSHLHVDHNGGSFKLKKAIELEGRELRIVGSKKLAQQIKRYKGSLVPPTEAIPNEREIFQFEKWTFKFVTPVEWAHSGADSYIITPDGVVKYVDFNYPGRLPLAYISSSQSITGWIEFLRHVLAEEWQFADLGHANIGYKKDIERTFAYLSDVYDAFCTIVAPAWERGEYFEPGVLLPSPKESAGVFWGNVVDVATEQMAQAVYDKWREVQHAEVIRSHCYKVFEDAFLHYNLENDPNVRPDFSPISPDERKSQ